jgi:hypothetical protein
MDKTQTRPDDALDWRFDGLKAFFKEERRRFEVFVTEEGIATRRHMDVVVAKIRAEIDAILQRHHLRETRPPASEEGRGPANLATTKLADR